MPSSALNPHTVSETGMPKSRKVMLLVDFLNPLDFEGAEDLAPHALKAARAAARLKKALCAEGWCAIYVNDNFGQWRSDIRTVMAACEKRKGTAGQMSRALAPKQQDLVILKPCHSGFHATPLDLLLDQLGARELVITGLATDYCVKCTAMDAYVRGYKVWVPADCTAAETQAKKDAALEWMADALKARITPSLRRQAGSRNRSA